MSLNKTITNFKIIFIFLKLKWSIKKVFISFSLEIVQNFDTYINLNNLLNY